MLKFDKSFFAQQKASISIEFAIVFPFLIFLFLFVLEFSRIMFIGSALNLLSAEITRKTAISENIETDYTTQFQQILEEEVPLWPFLTNSDNFNVTLTYCQTIEDTIADNCYSISNKHSHIMLFKLKYDYHTIYSSIFGRILDTSLKNKTIVYREFY